MGLDVWFRDDVARALAALLQASSRYVGGEYRDGYQAALQDVAIQFGLIVPENRKVPRELDIYNIAA